MKKVATNKSIDATIREKYGWTQNAMAAYLGVSRSLLSLCEIGERSLPPAASLRWLEWVKFTYVEDALEKVKVDLQGLPVEGKKLLQRATDAEWEATLLQRKLEALQAAYDKALNNIAICRHLLAVLPETAENTFARQQLELTLSIATGTHNYEGPEAIALLQCKIEGLLYEAQKCKEQAATLGKKREEEKS